MKVRSCFWYTVVYLEHNLDLAVMPHTVTLATKEIKPGMVVYVSDPSYMEGVDSRIVV
jgi:hypothetical protein